ncbi:CTD small phosphatase-like protein 2-A [Carettochelys insculpta]|uniref:CTD small phosphatase-like protein 2-A n=1 Tax=Carettochelys insculpta TaxID=44489 RepID=UPI003EBFC8DD
MMLRSGTVTPRVKKALGLPEPGSAMEELGPAARKASIPREGTRRWREEGVTEPGSPRAQPAGGVTYFSNLPPEQPEETVPLSPFHPRALPHTSSQRAPRKETPIKTRSTPESTLVLELEGTLVCCFLTSSWDADYTFLTDFQGDTYRLRPYVQEFLETISKTYEIFVFTTAKQDYAEKILDVLDPQKKLIRHCLYQQDCVCVQGYYVKDLAILERDLARTVALDDSLQGFPYQTSNCVPIPSWVGDHRDEELLRVIPLLGKLNQADDVRTEIRRKYRLCRLLAVD